MGYQYQEKRMQLNNWACASWYGVYCIDKIDSQIKNRVTLLDKMKQEYIQAPHIGFSRILTG